MRIYRKRRFTAFADFVCIFARNWKITGKRAEKPVRLEHEDEIINCLLIALNAINLRPAYSRGLTNTTDRAQVSTITGLNAEIEHDCWQFKLKGHDSSDTRSWADLVTSGDHKQIESATRTHFLDWLSVDTHDSVTIPCYGHPHRQATKREWHG